MNDRLQKPPYPLRMPDELRGELERAAKESGRSLNAEIVARLEKTLEGDAVTKDLWRALEVNSEVHEAQERYIKLLNDQLCTQDALTHFIASQLKYVVGLIPGSDNGPAKELVSQADTLVRVLQVKKAAITKNTSEQIEDIRAKIEGLANNLPTRDLL